MKSSRLRKKLVLSTCVLALGVLTLALPACADSFGTYSVNAEVGNAPGAPVLGSFTLDLTTNTVSNVNVTVTGLLATGFGFSADSVDFTSTAGSFLTQEYNQTSADMFTTSSTGGTFELSMWFPTTTVTASSTLCIDSAACTGESNLQDYVGVIGVELSQPTSTPEPSSLVFLGIGACGLVRRKLLR